MSPWQRVVNRYGMISIENRWATKKLQADLLKKEKIIVSEREKNYWVDLDKYLWDAERPDYPAKRGGKP